MRSYLNSLPLLMLIHLQEVSELFIAFPNSPEPGHAAVSSALASLGETTRALVGDITNEDSGAVLEWKLVSVFCRVHGLKTSIALDLTAGVIAKPEITVRHLAFFQNQ